MVRKMNNAWQVMPIWPYGKYFIFFNEKNYLNNFVSKNHAIAGEIEKAKGTSSGRFYSGKVGLQ